VTVRPVRIDWIGLNPALAIRTLGRNLAIVGALFEAKRRARIRCAECGEYPCEGGHARGLAGACCVCCPLSPAGNRLGDESV
jgi:hypothetical protein